MVQVRVYYETLMTKHEEQILEFTWEDLIGKKNNFLCFVGVILLFYKKNLNVLFFLITL